MPTIFRVFGFRFFFFNNEHPPPHVHIQGKDGAAKYDMENKELVYNKGMKVKDIKKAIDTAEDHRDEIMKEWSNRQNNI